MKTKSKPKPKKTASRKSAPVDNISGGPGAPPPPKKPVRA